MTTILAGVVIGAIGVAALLGSLRVSFAVLAAGLLLTLVFSFSSRRWRRMRLRQRRGIQCPG